MGTKGGGRVSQESFRAALSEVPGALGIDRSWRVQNLGKEWRMRILRRAGRRVIIDLVDDLDGTEAGETIIFELDGMTYEIDLSRSNANDLRRTLRPYIDEARATALH
jgi:hypothetical protein